MLWDREDRNYMKNSSNPLEIDAYVQKAVSHYWQTRAV